MGGCTYQHAYVTVYPLNIMASDFIKLTTGALYQREMRDSPLPYKL